MTEEYINKEQDRRLAELEIENKDLQKCLYKHVATFNHEMGVTMKAVTEIKTDVAWIKKGMWAVTIAVIGQIVSQIFTIITV